jgi:hypothetical protein
MATSCASLDPPAATRWIIAAAGVLMQLALGAIYGWSVFVTPLTRLIGED